MKYTIYWVYLGATNTLATDEYDTLIDFLDLLDDLEGSTIAYGEIVISATEFRSNLG